MRLFLAAFVGVTGNVLALLVVQTWVQAVLTCGGAGVALGLERVEPPVRAGTGAAVRCGVADTPAPPSKRHEPLRPRVECFDGGVRVFLGPDGAGRTGGVTPIPNAVEVECPPSVGSRSRPGLAPSPPARTGPA